MLPPNGRQTMIIGRRGVAGQIEGRPVRPHRGSEGGANVARVTNHFRRSDGAESSRVSRRTKCYPRAPVGRIFRLGLLLGRNSQLRRSNVLDTTKVLPPTVAPPTRPLSILQSIRAARRNVLEIIPELAYRQPMLSGRMGSRWHMVQNPKSFTGSFVPEGRLGLTLPNRWR